MTDAVTQGGSVLPLVRRWAVDWLASHDPAATSDLLSDDYDLDVGIFAMSGRAAYVDATLVQLGHYPGLVLTIHEALSDGRRAAVRFSEHGVSARHDGRAAVWTGVAMFDSAHGRLTHSWAEEDYHARRRQLSDGVPDPVRPPALAPWDTPDTAPDPVAVDAVSAWIAAGLPTVDGVSWDDDDWVEPVRVLSAARGVPDVVIGSGSRVAFHARLHGTAIDAGVPASIGVSGLVTVNDGTLTSGTVVSDRLGMLASVKPPAGSS